MEIIWGTAVDETIGDEMRVTVIATGIGEEKDVVAAPSRNIKGMKGIARGVVRDYTTADRKYEETLDLLTYYRLKQKRAEEKASREADAKKKSQSHQGDNRSGRSCFSQAKGRLVSSLAAVGNMV